MGRNRETAEERYDRLASGGSPASPLFRIHQSLPSQQRYSVAGYRMYSEAVDMLEAQDKRLRDQIVKKDGSLREKIHEVSLLKAQNVTLREQLGSMDDAAKGQLDKEREQVRALREELARVRTEATKQINAAQKRSQEVVEAAELAEDTTELLHRLQALAAEAETERTSRLQVQVALDEARVQLEAAERKAELKGPEVSVEDQSVKYRFKPRKTSTEVEIGARGVWTIEELQSVLTHLTVNGAEASTILLVSPGAIDANVTSDGLPPQPWDRPVAKESAGTVLEWRQDLDKAVTSARKLGFLVGLPIGVLGTALVGGAIF